MFSDLFPANKTAALSGCKETAGRDPRRRGCTISETQNTFLDLSGRNHMFSENRFICFILCICHEFKILIFFISFYL